MLWAGLPYYEDLELEIPVDYVEDYTLEERLGTTGRQQQQQLQQQQQQQQQQLQNKKVPQDFGTLPGNGNGKKD